MLSFFRSQPKIYSTKPRICSGDGEEEDRGCNPDGDEGAGHHQTKLHCGGRGRHCPCQWLVQTFQALGQVALTSLLTLKTNCHLNLPFLRAGRDWKLFRYVVIGAGKTGMDALLQLLDTGVNPDSILWIISQDCWFFNRWCPPKTIKPCPGTFSLVMLCL